MDRMTILFKAYEVADEIKSSDSFKKLKSLKELIDQKYKDEIIAFKNASLKYNEIMETGGTYHPDFKETVKVFSLNKRVLFEKKEAKAYLELESLIQKELDDISRSLGELVSTHIKTPNEFGFTKESSCHAHWSYLVHCVL